LKVRKSTRNATNAASTLRPEIHQIHWFQNIFFLRTNNFEEYSGMNIILRNKYFNILKQHAITDISYF